MINGPKKAVSVLMPLELHGRLSALAKADNRKLSAYIRRALELHVRQTERDGQNRTARAGV